MDDGLQFRENTVFERTTPRYVVAAISKRGELIFPLFGSSENREEVARWMAKAEARNDEWLGHSNFHIRVWLPEQEFMNNAITEEEFAAMQPAEPELPPAAESAEVPASPAPTNEQSGIAESGDYEVHVSGAGQPAGRFLAYRGDSPTEAKAAITRWRGHCATATTRMRADDGSWVWLQGEKLWPGFSYDAHKEWLDHLHAGDFDDAFMKDHLNEMMDRGRMTGAQAEREWDAYQTRKALNGRA